MSRYRPTDVEYEDIYDFGYLLDSKKTSPRRGQTYTLDDTGEKVRSLNRPKLSEKTGMRVPAVGNNTGELSRAVGYVSENREGPDRHSVRFTRTDPECNMANQSLTDRENPSGLRDRETRRQFYREPTPYHGPPLSRFENDLDKGLRSATPKALGEVNEERKNNNWDKEYELLMKSGHFDPSKDPRVKEYERRQAFTALSTTSTSSTASSGTSAVFARRMHQYEESVKPRNIPSIKPAHPSIPRIDTLLSSYRTTRRQPRHIMSDQNPGLSSASYHTPTTPADDTMIDNYQEVREATRLQRDLENFHREMARIETSVYEDMEIRPYTAAAANSNLPGNKTPCPIPIDAVPTKTIEPVRQRDGYTATRGLGFKSKLKRDLPRKIESGLIPHNTGKQIKKYFD